MRTAYLDIDGTLVEDGLWSVLIRQLITEGLGERELLEDCLDALDDPARSGTAALLDNIPTAFRNISVKALDEATERSWKNAILLPSTLELASTLRDNKIAVVLVSGAPQSLADRVGDLFSAEAAYACTMIPGMPGFLTTMTSPEAKGALVRGHGGDLPRSTAIGNGFNDVGMLAEVGHPIAIEPSPRLREKAVEQGWPITDRHGLIGCVKNALDLQ